MRKFVVLALVVFLATLTYSCAEAEDIGDKSCACLRGKIISERGLKLDVSDRQSLVNNCLVPIYDNRWRKSECFRKAGEEYRELRLFMLSADHRAYHYRANVDIWKQRIVCMDKLIMSYVLPHPYNHKTRLRLDAMLRVRLKACKSFRYTKYQ